MNKKHNEKHSKKIRNLVAFCSLCAIVLSVSTYAWFIGMKTVSVDEFEVNIATTEGLFLSMNGKDWSYVLDASKAKPYEGNANTWANTEDNNGLIPMSTVGDMDSTNSRMKLYEKGSFTSTNGGYRLLTSRVDNTKTPSDAFQTSEGKGYVAFDLFVKNLSGHEYYAKNDVASEEAIYLTTNSQVVVADSGNGGVANTGIENSVRVAFTQIGRVNAELTDVDKIIKINCTGDDLGQTLETDAPLNHVTGICRNAQIWEPNDTNHVENAIRWYNESCKQRQPYTGENVVEDDVFASGSYTGEKCKAPVAKANHPATSYETYAVSRELEIADQVNTYDGHNEFKKNSIAYSDYTSNSDASKLVAFPYFTDTMKAKTGTERPQFMTLAPNSITKLRVYIYLEGQDIDNYDFAQLGKKITVNFGFTKERYTEGVDFTGTGEHHDGAYNGPDTNITPASTATVAFN